MSKAAYIFDPNEDEDHPEKRPSKRRRVSKQPKSSGSKQAEESSTFVPLLNGAEKQVFVKLREKLYEASWAKIDGRIQVCVSKET